MKKLILAFLLVSGVFLNTSAAGDKQEVENFVSRFYTEVLGRTADTAGLADWTNRLVSGESAGSDVATGFIFSKEFTESPEFKNSETYVTTLYRAFFNRDADTGGLNGWLSELSKGKTKKEVLDGFLFSTEFANLCKAYGIKPVPDGATGGASGGGVEDFVKRFYAVVLGRTADAAGLADWVNRLNTKVATGADIAIGFVFSAEFDEKGKDDGSFLNVLYRAFFNRAADEGGLNGWLLELSKGLSRHDVLNGFLHSDEFVTLAESYGIVAFLGNTTIPNSNGEKVLIISKTSNSGNNFEITWNKKESGYSELVYKDVANDNKRGRYFFTTNSNGKHTLSCGEDEIDMDGYISLTGVRGVREGEVRFFCSGFYPSGHPFKQMFYFKNDKRYYISRNNGTELINQGTEYTLYYTSEGKLIIK